METVRVATRTIRRFGVVVWLHTAADPHPNEWASGIEAIAELLKKRGGDASLMRSFVVTDGGGPNAAQRKHLGEVFRGRPNKTAVVTNSLTNPVKRGLATAITWINPAFLAVPVERWQEAVRHVDLENAGPTLLEILSTLQKELPPVKSLELFARAVQTSAVRTPP